MEGVIELIIIVQHLPRDNNSNRADSLVRSCTSEQKKKLTGAAFPVKLRDLVDICETDSSHKVERADQLVFDRGSLVVGLHSRVTT